MKKTLLTLTLLCVALTLHALDYRRVIFGNSYENILEVDANSFFAENTEVKKQADFYRVYEQKIGRETFYRVLAMNKNYTDTMFLDWKNVSFTQDLYVVESNDLRLLIDDVEFQEESDDWSGYYIMGGIEIIERNNTVIGVMQFYNGNFTGGRTTLYYRWEDIRVGNGIVYTLYSAENYGEDGSSAKEALVDDRRPLMYTIQNAFDGDPATSFVNYGETIIIRKRSLGKDGPEGNYLPLPKLEGIMVINGYASGDYYYENNQIVEMSIGVAYDSEYSYAEYNVGYLYLEDSLKPQVMMLQRDEDEGKEDEYWYYTHIEKLVKGTKYNDTALAEIDFYIEGMGWLFGFADEENVIDLSTVNTIDGLRYDFTGNTATIITYNGNDTKITIPSEVVHNGKTYTVTAIGESAFENNEKIHSVIILDGVTAIGESAFEGCLNLSKIELPTTLKEISRASFASTGLNEIKIPDSLSVIEMSSFRATMLTTITIPDSVTTIKRNAFVLCQKLQTVIISENVKKIEEAAFAGCTNLTSITFLGKDTVIEPEIFMGYYAPHYRGDLIPFETIDNVVLNVYRDSSAYIYAKEHDIPYILLD